VLLAGAGLLARTFANLLGVAPGFDPHNVLTFQIDLRGERYATTQQTAAFCREAVERIEALPGVEAAAVTNKLPLDWQFNMPIFFADKPDQAQSVQFRIVSPDYFRAMKIDVREGRAFADADNPAAPAVAVVNEAFARRFAGGKDALRQQFSVGRGNGEQQRQVVGVVGDFKQQGLDRPAPATVFIPLAQTSDKLLAGVRAFTSFNFVARTEGPPANVLPAVRREIAGVDQTLPLSHVATMEDVASRSVASQRFSLLLLGLFAALGLALAAVGIYGVVSYTVTQRTHEIGVRVALGAQRGDVLRLVLGHGMWLTLAGVVLGIAGALALTRVMSSLLFGVGAHDPATFAAVALLLAAVSLVACVVPARRATRVDPMIALRYE
jgi:putative ABC transport system permease protein